MHGHVALPYGQRLVDSINALPVRPDFIIHTGDVVDDPQPDAFILAAKTLSRLEIPLYFVNGNHDSRSGIRGYFSMDGIEWLSQDPSQFSYAFEKKGYRFLILDARGPKTIDPQGQFSSEQFDILKAEISRDGPPLVIFVHYPILPMDSPWMDSNMLVTNGEQFHQTLLSARGRIRAVFHGHVHQSMQTLKDGIAYIAVASGLNQLSAWPSDQTTGHRPLALPGYNFVHLMPDQTIVHQHTVARP